MHAYETLNSTLNSTMETGTVPMLNKKNFEDILKTGNTPFI